jgi:serine/threonine protein kinase
MSPRVHASPDSQSLTFFAQRVNAAAGVFGSPLSTCIWCLADRCRALLATGFAVPLFAGARSIPYALPPCPSLSTYPHSPLPLPPSASAAMDAHLVGGSGGEMHTFEVLGSTFRIDRKYAPLKALGKGAFGVVAACKNRETGAKVRARGGGGGGVSLQQRRRGAGGHQEDDAHGYHHRRRKARAAGAAPAAVSDGRASGSGLRSSVASVSACVCGRWLGKHPNIVSLKDMMVDMELDTLYVVMELMDTDLHRIIVSTQPLGDAHFK